MQLAILIVLILILLVLSPVILSVFLALTAVVGIVFAWAIGAFAVLFFVAMLWILIKPAKQKVSQVVEIGDVRKICSGCQVEIPVNSGSCYNCGKLQ